MAKLNKGESDTVRTLFKFITQERKDDMDEFVLTCLSHGFHRFSSPMEIDMAISGPGYLTYDEASYIREYPRYITIIFIIPFTT